MTLLIELHYHICLISFCVLGGVLQSSSSVELQSNAMVGGTLIFTTGLGHTSASGSVPFSITCGLQYIFCWLKPSMVVDVKEKQTTNLQSSRVAPLFNPLITRGL